MALRKATQEDLEEFRKVNEFEVVSFEETDTVDRDGNDVPGLKVYLPRPVKAEGSIPLTNGKPLTAEAKEVFVTGEDVAKFKADLYKDDETGKLVYRGNLKWDVTKPWINNRGEVTKRQRIKLVSIYHSDFKASQQRNNNDLRTKTLNEMFGFDGPTTTEATEQKLALTTETE